MLCHQAAAPWPGGLRLGPTTVVCCPNGQSVPAPSGLSRGSRLNDPPCRSGVTRLSPVHTRPNQVGTIRIPGAAPARPRTRGKFTRAPHVMLNAKIVVKTIIKPMVLMVNSRATGNFIDPTYCAKLKITISKKERPESVQAVDSTLLTSEMITHQTKAVELKG
ncbi:hypothetical protein NDU88_003661 [Pleurodeles waltl]|uniref:Uncharacterized protein n=1 Tax=Pleurodeles waltl TaxID=8319 RepID=A0AAV7TPP7_PLEWA|nr:hypothetical protein NDU88_003661 [Pleurodeles waltl]